MKPPTPSPPISTTTAYRPAKESKMRSDEKTKMNDMKTRSAKPSAHQERIVATVMEAREKAKQKEETRKAAIMAFAAAANEAKDSSDDDWSDSQSETDPREMRLIAGSKEVKKLATKEMKLRRSNKSASYD